MISEGSYAGDAENAAAHHCNQLHLTIYSHVKWLFKFFIIFHNIIIFYCFDFNKCSLGEDENLLSKTIFCKKKKKKIDFQ